jgi:hypothetical protein
MNEQDISMHLKHDSKLTGLYLHNGELSSAAHKSSETARSAQSSRSTTCMMYNTRLREGSGRGWDCARTYYRKQRLSSVAKIIIVLFYLYQTSSQAISVTHQLLHTIVFRRRRRRYLKCSWSSRLLLNRPTSQPRYDVH